MKTKQPIYLDNAATTEIDPDVIETMRRMYERQLANPSSQHASGRLARSLLEAAKDQILAFVGAPCSGMNAAQLIVTSGGTEANNLAVLGIARARAGSVIISAIEHPSVLEAAESLSNQGRQTRVLPVDERGLCNVGVLEKWLEESHSRHPQSISDPNTAVSLVSIILGNNEIGTIQDLKTICELCHRYDVPVHSDAVQAMGKIPFSMLELGLDALTITAHKLHGPVGIGALVVRNGLPVTPMFLGGGQQLGIRPGTEATVLVAGFAKALELSLASLEHGAYEATARIRDRFEEIILAQFAPATVVSAGSPRLPHISNLAFEGLDRQALLMALDLAGIQCSAGSACSSGSSRPSRILSALGIPNSVANGALRFSFSRSNSMDEVELTASRVVEIASKMQNRSSFVK